MVKTNRQLDSDEGRLITWLLAPHTTAGKSIGSTDSHKSLWAALSFTP